MPQGISNIEEVTIQQAIRKNEENEFKKKKKTKHSLPKELWSTRRNQLQHHEQTEQDNASDIHTSTK